MKIGHIAAFAALGTLIVACGSDPTPTESTQGSSAAETAPDAAGAVADAKKKAADAKAAAEAKAGAAKAGAVNGGAVPAGGDDDDDDDGVGGVGGVGGAGGAGDGADGANGGGGGGVNQTTCCFNGQYFDCPSQAACLGGFDANACFGSCAPGDFQCISDCGQKASNTSGPTKECTAAAPPPGVTCSGGN